MLVLLLIVLAFAVPLLIHLTSTYGHEGAMFTSIIMGIVLALALLAIPISLMDGRGEVERFKAFKETIVSLRAQKGSDVERIMLAQKIVVWNGWLASRQYFNKSVWVGIYISDSVEELTPVR